MSTELDSAMKSANTLIDMCGKLMAERDWLKAANAELVEALEPFVDFPAEAFDESIKAYTMTMTGAHLIAARAALAKQPKETT